VSDLPRYGDIFTLKARINNTPVSLSEQAIPGGTTDESATFAYGIGAYGKAPLIAAAVIVLALLSGIIRFTKRRFIARRKTTTKKKVHHEEE
jgi:hypothetical protein